MNATLETLVSILNEGQKRCIQATPIAKAGPTLVVMAIRDPWGFE